MLLEEAPRLHYFAVAHHAFIIFRSLYPLYGLEPAKHIKALSRSSCKEESSDQKQETSSSVNDVKLNLIDIRERILKKLTEKLDADTIKLIGEEFVVDGDLCDTEEVNSRHEESGVIITSETISSWKEATEKLVKTITELRREIHMLKEVNEVMTVEYEIMMSMVMVAQAKLKKCVHYSALVFGFCFLASICISFLISNLASCFPC